MLLDFKLYRLMSYIFLLQPGRFILVSDTSNLRYSMARYYDFFSNENTTQDVTVAFPYLDAFGLGIVYVVVTMSTPYLISLSKILLI